MKFLDWVFILFLFIMCFLGGMKIGDFIKGDNNTLHLTQNSEFVVEKVKHDYEQWNYHFKLRNLNLEGDRKINTLIVQTDKAIGYAVGDTLKLLNHNN